MLAQLTRHRVGFSFSVQSQRYVRFGSGDRSGGFDYVVPDTVTDDRLVSSESGELTAKDIFEDAMWELQYAYDKLRTAGVPAEDARAVLPQASTTNLVMTVNLRALLDFYQKRRPGNGAQKEITDLAVALKDAVINVEPWTEQFFNEETRGLNYRYYHVNADVTGGKRFDVRRADTNTANGEEVPR